MSKKKIEKNSTLAKKGGSKRQNKRHGSTRELYNQSGESNSK